MLYLVSDDSMNRDVTRFGDDDFTFVVRADNDQELANAIAEVLDDNDYVNGNGPLEDWDGSGWKIRELSEPFNLELSICRKISAKRY